MEYIFLTLFVVIIISVLIFFLTSWQMTQLRANQAKTEADKTLYIMKFLIKSPYFTRGESQFDEAKLDAFEDMENEACRELNIVFGRDWFMDLYVLGDYQKSWSFCGREGINFTYQLPVNLYRGYDNTNHLARLDVGVYYESTN